MTEKEWLRKINSRGLDTEELADSIVDNVTESGPLKTTAVQYLKALHNFEKELFKLERS